MIYILGANGFVGSAFMRACSSSGMAHTGITRENYADYIGTGCDVFINANGNSKKYLANREPLFEFDASVRSVRASLEDFHYARYIYLSSCDVYPDCSSPQFTEENFHIEADQQSTYGFHKGLAEQCVRHTASSWLIFRMGGFVGPGLKKNPIYDILHGGPLWLDPKSELQYLSVDTAAEIVLQSAVMEVGNEIFNLCGKGLLTLQDAMDYAGVQVEIKPGSPLVRYDVSISKISDYFTIPDSRSAVFEYISKERNHKKESS